MSSRRKLANEILLAALTNECCGRECKCEVDDFPCGLSNFSDGEIYSTRKMILVTIDFIKNIDQSELNELVATLADGK